VASEPIDYCRQIETYLCQKNDGHLIRVVGPSFDLVSKWAADGVPLKVAFQGIDRYVERYYRQGPRRRPVRIDFCEADVLEAFDQWRRAVGLTTVPTQDSTSLPAHLERALVRLTSAHVRGAGTELETLIDRVSAELDRARQSARGLRGEARRALIDRLCVLDQELLQAGRAMLDESGRKDLERQADQELASFRDRMPLDAYLRARDAAMDTLVRQSLGLPTLIFG
jgi:hypothetical protein